MIKEPNIEKTLVISTGHITEKDIYILDHKNEYSSTVIQHPNGYGTIIHIHSDIKISSNFSKEFKNIIKIALNLNCQWINFDCDGEIYEELPLFEW